MINDIKNYTYKSFKNYSTPQNFFKRKNIIFGYNGRGKSSLSKGIVEEFLKQDKNKNSIRFFNRDYVKEQLLLEETDSTIKGIKISFSKQDVDISRKIKELHNQIENVDSKRKEIIQRRKDIRKEIDSIHDRKKGNANINKKPSKLELEDVIKQYSIDLENALKINNSKNYIKTFNADSTKLENEKNKITKIQLPNLGIYELPISDKEFLFNTLQKEYRVIEDIPTSEVIKWLEKGVTLHNVSDNVCIFCHNHFNLETIKESIKSYKENSIQKDIFRLEDIKEYLNNNINILNQAKSIKGNLAVLGCSQEEINNLFNFSYTKSITNLVKIIEEKISSMDKSFQITNNILELEKETIEKNKKIKDIFNNRLNEVNSSIHNIEKITKGTIAIAIKEENIQDKIEQIQKNEEEIKIVDFNNKKIYNEIRSLEEQKSEYTDFMNFLNGILYSLGIQIKLILKEDNYYLKHPLEECNLTINSISEGEKNLLALMYFYFELYSDKEQENFNSDIELVIIDDPISSLDDSNKFYVLEIVKRILSEKKPQIFILTHSWDDFSQITYGIKPKDSEYGLFEIYKNSKNNFHSEIQSCKNNIAPYKKLFQEIYMLKNKNFEELSQCEIYHASNSMRRVFEEFLNFKKPNLLPQKSNQKQIEDLFDKAAKQKLGTQRKTKLGKLLTSINVLSHRAIKANEIIENSKTLMDIIKDMDNVHYNAMKPD